jgi:hypothetical protein
MSTGTCGINCDVCKLNLRGVCSTCGSGVSSEGARKIEAQRRLLGRPCPILACARMKRIAFCMRDCREFPCANFKAGPYPYGQGFLEMQTRRLKIPAPAYAPDGSHLKTAAAHWDMLTARDLTQLCNLTFFEPLGDRRLKFRFLNEDIGLDLSERCLLRWHQDHWQKSLDPLLELVTVLYLGKVSAIYPLGQDMVGIKDLKEGHFFAGPHELRLDPLLQRYADDLTEFGKAAEALGGCRMDMADAAYRLLPYPRVPLYYLIWQGDEEFKPRTKVLFDRSIELVLAADAIWGLVNRVTLALLENAG